MIPWLNCELLGALNYHVCLGAAVAFGLRLNYTFRFSLVESPHINSVE